MTKKKNQGDEEPQNLSANHDQTKKLDPNNQHWSLFSEPKPLPLYKKGLKIFKEEGYLTPPNDPTMIT